MRPKVVSRRHNHDDKMECTGSRIGSDGDLFCRGNSGASFFDGVTPAVVQVTRDGDFFIFSSNSLQNPTNVCEFEFPIRILDVGRGFEFPSIGDFGWVDGGSVTVDRNELLAALGSREAHFAMFCTLCGSNTGDFGAQALRAKIRRLEDGESATLHTVYFPEGFSDNPERYCRS